MIARKRNIPLPYSSEMTQIRYGYVDQTAFPKKPFTRDDGYKYISKILTVLQSLLAQRMLETNSVEVDLISTMANDDLGVTHFTENTTIIALNFRKMACLEQLIVTFLHELSHLLEGYSNNEDHSFTFYAIHIALNAIFLQRMKSSIPIDFDLIKLTKVAYASASSSPRERSNENKTVVFID